MPPLLEIEDLHLKFKLYEGISHVLNGLSLSVERGTRVAIVGESGCGKSVTARIILGLLQQRNATISGSLRFEGQEMLKGGRQLQRSLRGRRIIRCCTGRRRGRGDGMRWPHATIPSRWRGATKSSTTSCLTERGLWG